MVAIARQKFPDIEFREGDAQNLPFSDATFDRVLGNFYAEGDSFSIPKAAYVIAVI